MERTPRETLAMMLDTRNWGIPATIVCHPKICGGVPTFRGTRIPVKMILAYLRAGYSRKDIFNDYPRLPLDGIEAAIAWAEQNLGPDRREKQPAA
jgi:uncharacterized protein (DUF433 family)